MNMLLDGNSLICRGLTVRDSHQASCLLSGKMERSGATRPFAGLANPIFYSSPLLLLLLLISWRHFFFFKEIFFREIKISLGGSVFKTSSANTSIMSQNHDKHWKQGGKMGGLINMFHNWALGIHLFQNSCSSNIKSHQWPICQRFSGHIFEIKISSSDLTSPSVLTWVMG